MTSTIFSVDELPTIDSYKLLTGLVIPRPIGWIGSKNAAGIANLAPFSFFNAVAASPPTVIFSPLGQPVKKKDTLANVRETGVFTVNIVSYSLVEAMNATAATVEADVDEFELANLTAVPGRVVDAPYVDEVLAHLECRVTQIVEVGGEPLGGSVVFGEVLAFEVDDSLLDGTRIDAELLDPVGRMAGNWYSRGNRQFSIERPA